MFARGQPLPLSGCFGARGATTAPGREPRFPMFAFSGRWANRARAGNGGLQSKPRTHTIGQKRSSSEITESGRSMPLSTGSSQLRCLGAAIPVAATGGRSIPEQAVTGLMTANGQLPLKIDG